MISTEGEEAGEGASGRDPGASATLCEAMERAQIEKVSRALADQTRLMIFEAISGAGQMNCGEIVKLRGVTPATVSHHLKILSEAGLIACRRQGQFVYSRTVPETVAAYARAVALIAKKKTGRQPGRKKATPGKNARASRA